MANADPPAWISTPVPVSTDFSVRVQLFSDRTFWAASAMTGKVVKVYILNPGVSDPAAAIEYTVTVDPTAPSLGTFTLTGTSHPTAGIATAQVHVDGMLRGRYQWEFVAKYS